MLNQHAVEIPTLQVDQQCHSHLIQHLKECNAVLLERRATEKGRQDTHGKIEKRFRKSRRVFISTSSPRIASMEFINRRTEQNQDLRCQSGPSAKDSVILSGGDSSKKYEADQQRLQILDLHFDKFPTPATFVAGRFDSRPRYALFRNFRRKRCVEWRWLIQWMIFFQLHHQYEAFQCRILKYLMQGLFQH